MRLFRISRLVSQTLKRAVAYRQEIGRLLGDREGHDSRVRVRDGHLYSLASSSVLSIAGEVDLRIKKENPELSEHLGKRPDLSLQWVQPRCSGSQCLSCWRPLPCSERPEP